MKAPRSLRSRRGSSFIEILVSLALLAVVMVGILQMFTLSLLTNFGSAARTDLLYKAQQVVENLRLIYFLQREESNTTITGLAGVPDNLAATTTGPIYLPYVASGDAHSSLSWNYWGPNGFNIVEAERLPYRLSYTVEARGVGNWLVTVTATPVDNPNLLPAAGGPLPDVDDTSNPRRFFGLGSKLKIVTYSAMIEN